ncbi:cytoplasmic protein [Mucidula mucida]|nr:cytoplasmic protein [Mucidula mucida]
MEIYTVAFSYPRARHTHSPTNSLDFAPGAEPFPTSHQFQQHAPTNLPSEADADAVAKLAMLAGTLHGCHVSFFPTDQGRGWNFHITGPYQQVMITRGMILKECPVQHRAAIKVTRSEILDSPSSKPALKPEVRRRLDDIASQTLAHIAVVNSPLSLSNRTPPDGISSSAGWSGLDTERICELVVTGPGDSVDLARVRLLVMLDELSGLKSEMCELDHKIIPILAGKKRHVLQSIQEETGTNIYLPSPLQGLVGPDLSLSPGTSGASRSSSSIWITGEFFGVQRARDMLYQASTNKSKSVISRDTAILPRKLDWMVTDRPDDLRSIMSDNATFIQFPPLGSSTSLITVFGDNRVNIQRTIRSIMQLACTYYFNALLPPATLAASQVSTLLKQISLTTGAEVVFKSMCFEMHGLEHEVRAAVNMVMDLDIIKAFQHEIRFQIELSNEHREFISGKKNGKINKIMQTTNVKIKFETFNDHNFLIDISGPDGSVLSGLSLLQEELPAEISFHVPEAYHKRIIGVGGRSIQRIMKKYGVYVKFSNAEEFAALGGYNDNDDNTNSHVRFPDKEMASDVVSIYGPESQVQIAAAMLLEHVPFEADMAVPPSSEVPRLCNSQEFLTFTEGVKRDLQVSIVPNIKSISSNGNGVSDVSPEYSFKFRCQRSNSDFLITARELLEQWLLNHNVHVYPSPTAHTHKRGDSFAEAFPHFDSKVLSATKARSEWPSTESADMSRTEPVLGLGERRLRLANSSPDVKALFNSPAYIYKLEDEDNQGAYLPNHNLDYWSPLPPIGSGIPSRTRTTEDALKRGSDSLLEAKLKEQISSSKPRSLSNRAQSLDLSMSLSRITESTGLPPPGSPTNSTGGNSSPTSATAPSFPSVYGPPMSSRSAVIGSGRAYDDEVDVEASRMISNLGL